LEIKAGKQKTLGWSAESRRRPLLHVLPMLVCMVALFYDFGDEYPGISAPGNLYFYKEVSVTFSALDKFNFLSLSEEM
jgi:hypothetical protein